MTDTTVEPRPEDVASGPACREAIHAGGGRGRLGRRLLWTGADQLISSATNAAVSFLVARQLGTSEFGSFAVAFIAFAFVSGLSRALVTDAVLIRFSAADPLEQRRAVADAAGAMLIVGAVSAVACAVLGLVADGLTGAVFVALAVVLPGLLLQGAWRQSFFAAGRPDAACLNDLLWAGLQIGGILLAARLGGAGVIGLMLVWGAAATVAAAAGALQAGTRPDLRGGVAWLRAHRDLGSRLATEFAISQGAANGAVVLVGLIAGIVTVGSIRGAQVLLGPVLVLFFALTSFALPLLARRVAGGVGIARHSLLVAAAAGGLTLSWAGALLVLPDWLGRELLGETWAGARDVLALVGLQWAVIGVAMGASLGLKAHARAGTLLTLTLVQAPLMLGLGTGGAALAGARGAVAGFVVAQLVGAVLNWTALLRAISHRRPPRHRGEARVQVP